MHHYNGQERMHGLEDRGDYWLPWTVKGQCLFQTPVAYFYVVDYIFIHFYMEADATRLCATFGGFRRLRSR